MAELYFPFLPHDKTRQNCNGFLIPKLSAGEVRLVCGANSVDPQPRAVRGWGDSRGLLPDVMTFSRCPHCQTTQVFRWTRGCDFLHLHRVWTKRRDSAPTP